MSTQVISSVPAAKVPFMWGSATLATEVSSTSMKVPSMRARAMSHLKGEPWSCAVPFPSMVSRAYR